MPLDLYSEENAAALARRPGVTHADAGAWDGFVRGTGMYTMQGFAKVGRSIDMLGSIGPIVQDAFTGGTEAQDRYFREHDTTWGSAVDYWTPRPNEVGVAGQVAGSLLSMLPMVVASPSLVIGSTQLSTAEDLIKEGISAGRAQAVGASQAVGLGLGIYAPIFGRTFLQRTLLAGAGVNALQGIAMRAAGGAILEGTPQAEQFRAFDPTQLTLDVLLGAAFGVFAHLSPAQRAQSAAAWEAIGKWAQDLRPSAVDALAVLRQSQHLNADSLPGVPANPVDVDHHVQQARAALEQVHRGQPVEVSDMPAGNFAPDEARNLEAGANARVLTDIAERVRVDEGLPPPPEPRAEGPAANQEGITPPPPRGALPGEAAGPEAKAAGRVFSDRIPPEQVPIERAAYDLIDANREGLISEYFQRYGNTIDPDKVKALFPAYRADKTLAPAVHEPSSELSKAIYARALEQNPGAPVLFTAGGGGSGKSESLPYARSILGVSDQGVVFDSTLSSFGSAVKKIQTALDSGSHVDILYTNRHVSDAFDFAMKRDRVVPLTEVAAAHVGAADTIRRLAEHYRNDPRVEIQVVNNFGNPPKMTLGDVADVPKYVYNQIEGRLYEQANEALRSGRLSAERFAAFTQGARGEGAQGVAGREPGQDLGRPGPGRRSEATGSRSEAAGLTEPSALSRAAGQAGEQDPLALASARVADEHPDLRITLPADEAGNVQSMSIREFLENTEAAVREAHDDAGLFEVAALCLLGGQ